MTDKPVTNIYGDYRLLVEKLGRNATHIVVIPVAFREKLGDEQRVWHFAVISKSFAGVRIDYIIDYDIHECDRQHTAFIADIMLANSGRRLWIWLAPDAERAFRAAAHYWPCDQTARWVKWFDNKQKRQGAKK
ncbi:hypothetical protein [Phyllobacterium chamaecytisi]|uniref:hypothetical protein n=1 Tax=Phyllobacterium chamaecytisi TaxID=2876082 RepID=UPI001CC937B7|nr:hypothetical protein [Phyllobacterium sp. KW56]MBZ9603996.1 hypothetical protein [Phyllobacterium sp. KW56]